MSYFKTEKLDVPISSLVLAHQQLMDIKSQYESFKDIDSARRKIILAKYETKIIALREEIEKRKSDKPEYIKTKIV